MSKFIRVLTQAELAAKKRMAKNPWRNKAFTLSKKSKYNTDKDKGILKDDETNKV